MRRQACENLVNLKLPDMLITAATSVPERAAPAPVAPPAGAGTVPADRDVRGVIRPSRDSDITADPSKPLTRPLCPYPQVAQYRGSGDVNDAANFACAAPSSR